MKEAVSPVSYPVNVVRLPRKGLSVTIEADAEQCAILAREHGLERVDGFSADLLFQHWKRDGVRVTGVVKADVVQSCVVTLEPVEAAIEAPVSAVFVPEGSPLARDDTQGGEIVVDAEADDLPEPFAGGRIDAGALAEEFFALAIDRYPRKEGAAFRDAAPADGAEREGRGPLAEMLGRLTAGR